MRDRMITNLCSVIGTLDCSTAEEQTLLLSQMQEVCREASRVMKVIGISSIIQELFQDLGKDLVSLISYAFRET